MPYALREVELTEPLRPVQLGDDDTGLGLVSRRQGRVVGFAIHCLDPGARLQPAEVEALLDRTPVEPPVLPVADGPGLTITVVVCTRDRPDLLSECLASLVALDPPPDEVLVIDNAPTDSRTRDLVTQLGFRYEVEPRPGLDFARNRALRSASGEVVAFVDDDVVCDPHWLTSLRQVWQQHPDAGAVTGQILPRELATDAQVAFERRGGFRGGNKQIRYAGQHLQGNAIYPYGPGMFGAGANMSFRRKLALRIGAFDEALDTGPPLPGGGDIDMMHRVIRHGAALIYEPRAVVFHRHRRDVEGLLRQYDSWGRSTMAFADKTYRRDPAGRPKIRSLVRWFFATQLAEVRRGVISGDPESRDAAIAQLRGGVAGLIGTYGRSQRRSWRRRRDHGEPTVAILPWGDVFEDYLDPIGLSLDDVVERMSGGWLFGFVEALRRAGVRTVIVCWSRNVDRPIRRTHVPTGAGMWFLPPSPAYRVVRACLADPYAWSRRRAVGDRTGVRAAAGVLARSTAPYLTTPPGVLAGILRREACRAILCQEYEEGRFDVSAALGRLLRVPVFATFQGGDHTRTMLERWLRPRAVRSAAGLVVGAEHEAERVRDRYGLPDDRIARIPNPLDPSTVPLTSKAAARAALGIPSEARVAVWCGRVDIQPKGIDTLVEAWRQVHRSGSAPVTLLLLGTGSGAQWLEGQIRDSGLKDIRWRNEFVLDRHVIGTYLCAADVYVLPSRQEGFPVAPVEAMAAGLPIVATDAPGVRAVVGEGAAAAGVVVPRGDAPALAVELRRFLDDPALSTAVGERASRRVAEQFSLNAVGRQLRSVLVDGMGEP